MRKPLKKKNIELYSCKLKKIEELPLVLTTHLEMKFKFLIETYMQLHQAMGNSNRRPIIFNIIDISKLLDQIAKECAKWITNKEDVQLCLEAIDVEERIDRVQRIIQNTRYIKSYSSDIERAAQNNLRNKKVQEYYSEMLRIGKNIVDGKKAK